MCHPIRRQLPCFPINEIQFIDLSGCIERSPSLFGPLALGHMLGGRMIGLSSQCHFRLSARLGSMISSPFFWAAITLCGLAVRFRQFLFVHSYWYDEAFLVLAVRARSLSELLGPQPYNLVIPPLYMGVIQ